MMKNQYKTALTILMALAISAGACFGENKAKEQELIKIISSNVPNKDKAIPCKELAIYGTKDAVPALSALLPDPELSSWARIALEAIPGPEADEALRAALDKVPGKLVIGVINSIGYRRDAKAIEALAVKLKDADADIASSAAASIGKIGGEQAAAILEPALGSAPEAVRLAVAEGCIYCAEHFLDGGKAEQAMKLYDAVRKAEVSKPWLVQATRGAIISRGTAGIPLLLEQLRSSGAFFQIGLRVARELPGVEVTDALIAEVGRATADRQPLIVIALGDRGDAKALPVVLQLATAGEIKSRIAAAGVLEKLGNVTCVPALLDAAASDDAELSKTAKATLARLKGADIDAALLTRMEQSTGKVHQILIQLAEERKIPGAMALFVKNAQSTDAGVRSAALDALGALGDDKQAPELVTLLQKAEGDDRGAIEKALMSICGRWPAACLPHLAALEKSGNAADRISAIHALSTIGGAEALAYVKGATGDADAGVKDEAVRTLSTWPNKWPNDASVLEPLMEVAKSGTKAQHKVLAIRGYIQFVHGARSMAAEQRIAKLNELLPLVNRPEEKRLAIAALGAIGTAGTMEPLVGLAGDPVVGDEACSALYTLAEKRNPVLSKEQMKTALETVVAKTHDQPLKNRAEAKLRAMK